MANGNGPNPQNLARDLAGLDIFKGFGGNIYVIDSMASSSPWNPSFEDLGRQVADMMVSQYRYSCPFSILGDDWEFEQWWEWTRRTTPCGKTPGEKTGKVASSMGLSAEFLEPFKLGREFDFSVRARQDVVLSDRFPYLSSLYTA